MIKLSEVWTQERIQSYKANGAREVICPICRNETLNLWTICPHCQWEYDDILKGYSPANRARPWWYRLKYRFKKRK